ncbi:hypothetical protein [Ferrimicrobium acidiphilum]|uniref:hypothetical protein n=1 Tax=Ferrimicrobium acidiphilum TaxID=121039 RepID=UPI0023F38784|nr:hypothetical protein [Ferrimicrobium acidiphilum]
MIDDPLGDPSYPNLLASREQLRNYSQDSVLCRSGASAKVGAVRGVEIGGLRPRREIQTLR